MMKEVSNRILSLSLQLPSPLEKSQLWDSSWHVRHTAMSRMIPLMMIQTLELTIQKVRLGVINPHYITCLHPVAHILWLFSVTEFEIIKDIKIFLGLLPALRTAFQSADNESAKEDHRHDSQHRERQAPHTWLRLLKDLLDSIHCNVDVLHYNV